LTLDEYASFTQPVYELLATHGIIDRALGFELKGRSTREKLVERIGAAYLWGIERLDGQPFRNLLRTANARDFVGLTRLFWIVRNQTLRSDQRERILEFWNWTLEWAARQPEPPAPLLSTLGLLATHIMTIGARERHLLEAVAPHIVGYESHEFVSELLRLAPQDPVAITKVLKSMLSSHAPEYDYEGRLRSLLETLAEHGQREAVIVLSDRLRHLEGFEALFKILTRH
jgi:hypothetical protein